MGFILGYLSGTAVTFVIIYLAAAKNVDSGDK